MTLQVYGPLSPAQEMRRSYRAVRARIASKAIDAPPPPEPIVYMPTMAPILQPNIAKVESKLGLEPWFNARRPSYLTVAEIQDIVAAYFDVRVADILSRRQNPDHIAPRHVAMYLARTTTPHGYLLIGRIFGRDHSTVISAYNKMVKRVKAGDLIVKHITAIEKIISERAA